MKASDFVSSGLTCKGYAGRIVKAMTTWRAVAMRAVKPGRFMWFGLERGGVKVSPMWWQLDQLANGATPVLCFAET